MRLKINTFNGAGAGYVSYECSQQGYQEVDTLVDNEQNALGKIILNPNNLKQTDFSDLQNYLISVCPENSLSFEVIE
jgi:hypothetical protein